MCGCKKAKPKRSVKTKRRIVEIKKIWEDTQNPKQKIKKL